MSGGLSRVAFEKGKLMVNSSQSGGGKDTWDPADLLDRRPRPRQRRAGVAVQSHWSSVRLDRDRGPAGRRRGGHQANADRARARALDLLAAGVHGDQALATPVAKDPPATRARWRSSTPPAVSRPTPARPVCLAGHVIGAGVSCQANIMATERVWPAMLEGFGAAGGSLTSRLLAALDAAEARGAISGAASPPRSSSSRRMPSRGRPWCRCGSRTTPSRCRSSAARGPGRRVQARRPGRRAVDSGHHDEAARLYVEASEWPPGTTS